KG
ncbi:glutamine synthetase, catalytic domain protein, partial [Vibrio parahaemolyticus V-223/04]